MSDRLRDALRVMKEVAEQPTALPLTYLHNPDTGEMFGALVSIDFLQNITDDRISWEKIPHDHREGDEDE